MILRRIKTYKLTNLQRKNCNLDIYFKVSIPFTLNRASIENSFLTKTDLKGSSLNQALGGEWLQRYVTHPKRIFMQ